MGKAELSRDGVAPSPTPQCGSYLKASLQITLDLGPKTIYIYIYNIEFTKKEHCQTGTLPNNIAHGNWQISEIVPISEAYMFCFLKYFCHGGDVRMPSV